MKQQEIKKLQTISTWKNGEHHCQRDSISFFFMSQAPPHNSIFIPRKNEWRCSTIMLMLRMREFADRKLKNAQKKCAGPGLVTLKSRGTWWLRILLRWAHLLHRSTSETGGSVLKYDFEYILLHYAIGFYIPLTFVFGLTGKLHPAKKNRQLLLMNYRAGEEVGEIHCNTNALDIISWK